MRALRPAIILGTVAVLVASACSSDGTHQTSVTGGLDGDPGNCVTVDMAVSPEKLTVLTELANTFNDSGAKVSGKCIFVRPARKASGGAAQLLVDGWPNEESNGPKPVIWSPASTGWGAIVNERSGQQLATDGDTVHVDAARHRDAEADGGRARLPGNADRVRRHRRSWPTTPRVGPPTAIPSGARSSSARRIPTSPRAASTSPIAEYYAATGKTAGLTLEDLQRPSRGQFADNVEQTRRPLRRHHADVPQQLVPRRPARQRARLRVGGRRRGEVDHRLQHRQPRRHPRPGRDAPSSARSRSWPSIPRRARSSPTARSSSSTRRGSTHEQKRRGKAFEDFVQQPENQQKVLEFGFRPGNPAVPVGEPIIAANGVDPTEPQVRAGGAASREVLVGVLDAWAQQRKEAKVLFVLDVSGSMGDPVDDERQHQARPREPGGGQLARQVQGQRRGRPAGVHHRPRRQRTRSTSSSCRPRRWRRTATVLRSTIEEQLPTERHAAVRGDDDAFEAAQHGLRPVQDQCRGVPDRRAGTTTRTSTTISSNTTR